MREAQFYCLALEDLQNIAHKFYVTFMVLLHPSKILIHCNCKENEREQHFFFFFISPFVFQGRKRVIKVWNKIRVTE